MRLMLLRHAKTEKAEPGMRDHVRRLTERGRHDAPVIGAYMARHKLIPDRVLVSTSERTRETWEHLAPALSARPRVIYEERLYNAGADAILALVQKTETAVKSLLVIGHNPGLHDLARLLIATGDVEARERLNEGLPNSLSSGNRPDDRRRVGGAERQFSLSLRLVPIHPAIGSGEQTFVGFAVLREHAGSGAHAQRNRPAVVF